MAELETMPDGVDTTSQSEQQVSQNPYEGIRVREVQPESTAQTVKRNVTPETDTSRKALGPGHEWDSNSPQAEGEQQYKENFGSPVEQFYGKIKRAVDEHAHHLDETVLSPFRQGLDNMAADLKQAGSTGHTQTGAPMNPVTQGLATAAGHALDAVPVGHTVGQTAQMAIAPPMISAELKPLNALEESANTVKQLGEQSAAEFAGKDAKGKIEHIGMVHKGEVVPGTGVHQVEHPDLPGKTFAIRESEMSSPEAMKAIADQKLEGLKSAPTTDELNARMKAENAAPKTAGKAEKIESQQIKEGPNKAAWTKQNVDYEVSRLRDITRNPQATAEEKGIAQHQLDTLKQIEGNILKKGTAGLGKNIAFGDEPKNNSRMVIEGVDEPKKGQKAPAKRASDRPAQKNWPPKVTDENSYDKNTYDPWAPNYSKKAGAKEPVHTT